MVYEEIFEKIEDNIDLNKEEIVKMLEIENCSDYYYRLLYISNKLSRIEYKNKGYIFTQIGLNCEPCSGNCKFCSLGKDNFSAEKNLQNQKKVY